MSRRCSHHRRSRCLNERNLLIAANTVDSVLYAERVRVVARGRPHEIGYVIGKRSPRMSHVGDGSVGEGEGREATNMKGSTK